MNPTQTTDSQSDELEKQLVGVNAKTAPYPAARSWSGGRRRILGREFFETNTYHVMSRTCVKRCQKSCQAFCEANLCNPFVFRKLKAGIATHIWRADPHFSLVLKPLAPGP